MNESILFSKPADIRQRATRRADRRRKVFLENNAVKLDVELPNYTDDAFFENFFLFMEAMYATITRWINPKATVLFL
jgi:hypothetical protein